MTDDDDVFNWSEVDVVVPHQPAICCYLNPTGGVVIRQDQTCYGQNDVWILVRPENVRRVVTAMLALIEPERPLALPAPMSPAERSKRYRENKRHEQRHGERDAPRDGNLFEASEVRAND